MGKAVRLAVGAAIALMIGAAAFFLYKQRGRFLPRRRSSKNFAAAAGPPQIPRQLLEEAAALYRGGKIREAWAFCFRAFSAAFSLRLKINFPPDATEYETLSLVKGRGPEKNLPSGSELEASFAGFVSRWVAFAYGGKEPEPGSFERSLAACRSLLEQGFGE